MNPIDQVVAQIGSRYFPKGMKLHQCEIHGLHLAHYTNSNPECPYCSATHSEGNGVTATQVEHYIDIRDAMRGI